MQYEVSFGHLNRPSVATASRRFRLAVLADISGRANAGKIETGAALATRKPIRIDVDTLEPLLAKLNLTLSLPFADDGTAVAVKITSIDDFHPDQLVENVALFEQLLDLRRNLASKSGFDRAAKEVLSWSGEEALPPPPRKARGTAVATDKKLSDFSRLLAKPSRPRTAAADASVEDLIRRIVGPLIQPATDKRQDQLIARVDVALSAAMRRVLHHPDFQAAEAVWRGLDHLTRHLETGDRLEIVLYDVSAEELAADLAATDDLAATGLFGMLVEQPSMDAGQGPISAILGLYQFELTPPHADLLGRIAMLAATANAPFIAAIGPDALAMPMRDQHPLVRDSWGALHALPEAAAVGLATPRFLLRLPYGKKSDPIDAFTFEEFTRQSGLAGMLWGHPALIAGQLLAETWLRGGAKMPLGSVASVGEMAYYVYTDTDGEQLALPCTERLYSERQVAALAEYRVMPLVSLRGRPEVRLASFNGLAGKPIAGFWAPADRTKPKIAPPAAVEAAPPPAEPTKPTAQPPPVPAEPQAVAPPAAAEMSELDALLAGLTQEAPAAEAEKPADAEDDLDALLASLNAEPPPPAEDATEADLDALLASLK
jgi:type VI secretion system protein ImpC